MDCRRQELYMVIGLQGKFAFEVHH